MTQHDLTTSEGGRAYVAEFFSTRLRRHDFGRYIAERLAADFACALAEYLNQHLGRIERAATEEMIRFCPECGCLGDIPSGYQACCPDSSEARVVPKRFAAMCADTFQLCVSQPYPSDVAAPSNTDRATPPSRYTPEYANVIEQLCASLGWHRNKAALLDSDGVFRARTDDAVAIWFANRSTSCAPTPEQAETAPQANDAAFELFCDEQGFDYGSQDPAAKAEVRAARLVWDAAMAAASTGDRA